MNRVGGEVKKWGEGIHNHQQTGNSLILLSLHSPSYSSLSLSLSSDTDRSTDASVGIRSLDFPSHCLSSAPLLHLRYPPNPSSSSSRHHGEQITARPSWDHGCLPLQRSQRSVLSNLYHCFSLLDGWIHLREGSGNSQDKKKIDKVSEKVTLSFVRDN